MFYSNNMEWPLLYSMCIMSHHQLQCIVIHLDLNKCYSYMNNQTPQSQQLLYKYSYMHYIWYHHYIHWYLVHDYNFWLCNNCYTIHTIMLYLSTHIVGLLCMTYNSLIESSILQFQWPLQYMCSKMYSIPNEYRSQQQPMQIHMPCQHMNQPKHKVSLQYQLRQHHIVKLLSYLNIVQFWQHIPVLLMRQCIQPNKHYTSHWCRIKHWLEQLCKPYLHMQVQSKYIFPQLH